VDEGIFLKDEFILKFFLYSYKCCAMFLGMYQKKIFFGKMEIRYTRLLVKYVGAVVMCCCKFS
jgi:hypothetical protein